MNKGPANPWHAAGARAARRAVGIERAAREVADAMAHALPVLLRFRKRAAEAGMLVALAEIDDRAVRVRLAEILSQVARGGADAKIHA